VVASRRSWLAAVGLLAFVGCGRPAAAQAGPFPVASNRVVLWSARSCYAEASWSQDDCTALMHVIRKRSTRFHWPFIKMLKAYSVKNWAKSGRGSAVLGFQLGFNKGKSRAWNARWRRHVGHVVDVLNHRAEDPCPIADHWAAKDYRPKSPMRRVVCDVETANAFWVAVASR